MSKRPVVDRRLITDSLWELLEPLLEDIKDPRGTAPGQSDREFLEAVLHLVRTGLPWRDCHPTWATGTTSMSVSAVGRRPDTGLGSGNS